MSRSPFRLKSTIGRHYSVDLDDVLKTKQALVDLGDMRIPDYGLTPYPDDPLFEAIQSYQRRNNLKADGVIEPDGPTLQHLNRSIQRKTSPANETNRQNVSLVSDEANDPVLGLSTTGTESEIALPPLPGGGINLVDLLRQFSTPLDDDTLQLALSERATNLAGLSDREKDLCDERFRREMQRCARLPGQWHGACAQRATIRWAQCYRYGYPPGPDREPPEWGPGDMEEGGNPRR